MRYSKSKVAWLQLGADPLNEADALPLAQAEHQRQAARARPVAHGAFSLPGPCRPNVGARLALTL